MEDYYDVLDVDEDATQEEIKEAYRRLAKKHHPDSKGGNEEMFKKVNKAHSVLGDEESRKKYDRERNFSSGNGDFGTGSPFSEGSSKGSWSKTDFDLNDIHRDVGMGGISMEDIFEEFTKERRRQRRSQPQRNLKITLPFKESLTKTVRRISADGIKERVEIPGGVFSGWTTVLDPERNISLMVDVEEPPPDKFYKRERLDLYKKISLNALWALSGAKVRIKNVYDQKIEVKIPPQTEPGELFLISNEGIEFKDEKGDLYLRVDYRMPDLSNDERTELKHLARRSDNKEKNENHSVDSNE